MSKSIKTWFNGLSPDKKRKAVVGGALSVIMVGIIIAVVATDDGSKPVVRSNRKKVETSILMGGDPQKVGVEQLTAGIRRQDAETENLKRQVQALSNQINQQNGTRGTQVIGANSLPFPYANGGGQQEVVALPGTIQDPTKGANGSVTSPGVSPIRASDQALDKATSGAQPNPGSQARPSGQPPVAGQMALPPPNIPGLTKDNTDVYGPSGPSIGATQGAPDSAPAPPPKLKLRVLTPRQDAPGGADVPVSSGSSRPSGGTSYLAGLGRSAPREPEFYIPMGSIISGTLLTGIDAPASGSAAKKDPFPALFRIKKEAILPNSGLLDLRECFIVASAYGELSSERVYMRAEGLSCQRSDGAIIEASIDAYASGGDGKAGIRGDVIEKTGQLIGRSLLAGFVGGIGKEFKPQQSQQVNVTSATGAAGTTPFQFPSGAYVVGNGLLSGGAAAAERISTIYEDLARTIVPVISINAGIPIDFIMTRGTTLRFKKVGEVAAVRPDSQAANKPRSGDGLTTSVTGSAGGPFSVTPGDGTSMPAPNPGGPSQTLSSRKP
jgi:conjugal transfer pilus assembly protein TraB